MHRASGHRGLLGWAAALMFAWAAPATANDVWTTPFEGVKQLHRTTATPKWSIHALVIDTTAPGVMLDEVGVQTAREL